MEKYNRWMCLLCCYIGAYVAFVAEKMGECVMLMVLLSHFFYSALCQYVKERNVGDSYVLFQNITIS